MIVVPGGAAYGSSSCAEDTGEFTAGADAAVPLVEAVASAAPVVPPSELESLAGLDSSGPGGGTMTVSEVSTPDSLPALDPGAAAAEPESVVDVVLESAAVPEPALAADAAEGAEGRAVIEPGEDEAAAEDEAMVSGALAVAQ